MSARRHSSISSLALSAVLCSGTVPAFAQTAPTQTPAQQQVGGGAAQAPAKAPAEAAPAAQELPQVEVITEQKAPKPVAKKTVKKVAKQKPVVTQPVVQTAPPPPSDPEILSPDAIEAAGRNTGQQTNSPAGQYNKIQDYVAEGSAVGTKTGAPLKETPQSITVVGKEQIRDQGAQSLQEATRYVAGVVADPYGPDSRGDSTIIRGLPAAYFIDGLRATYGYSQTTVPIEPYALDRFEVLRGPASMLYGQVPTGGLVNASSKMPLDVAYNEIGFDYGSFDYKQIRFDSTGPITSDGKWLYRITGLARDADTQVDYVENNRLMIQPSITYRPTNDTSITVLGHIRDDKSGSTQQFMPAEGTLFPNTVTGQRLSRDTFTGEPGDHYDTESQSVSLFVDHKFGDDLKLHHSSRYAHTQNDYDSTYAAILTPARMAVIDNALGALGLPAGTLIGSNAPFLNADHTEVGRARTVTFQDTDVFNTDTNLTGTFFTGGMRHIVTGGVDYMTFGTDQRNAGTLIDNLLTSSSVNPFIQPFLPFPLQPTFNLYNPQYGQTNYLVSFTDGLVSPDALPMTQRPHEQQTQVGLYLQDQIKIGSWIAVLGLRQDWLKAEQDGAPDEDDKSTTGRAALMYEFDFGLSPYISYSTSFTPQPGQPVGSNIFATVAGETLRPAKALEGEQVEVGFKYQPKGVPFIINAAYYELTERNQIVQPDILFDGVQGADVSVRGFEIEAIGKITPELKVIGAYSYTDAVYDKYPELYLFSSGISDYMEGKPVDGVPKNLASLWAIYSVQSGPLRGLSFGGGVRYVDGGESYGREVQLIGGLPVPGQELIVKTPAYTLFDAMVAFETPDWRWQLMAQNLEDEYTVTSCSAYRGDCFLGQGRTILTGFTYKF